MSTLMWSKVILNPKKDNLANGFLKPEYPFKVLGKSLQVQYTCCELNKINTCIQTHDQYIKLLLFTTVTIIIKLILLSGHGHGLTSRG